jgi:phospholipase A-2-activating protein
MLKWPKNILFPVLDIVRLAVRHQDICTALGAAEFLDLITENLKSTPANQLMSIRFVPNDSLLYLF